VASYSARFTGHVFPGETLVTSMWVEDGERVVESKTKTRGGQVLVGVLSE
jgi:acyl dehydratase